MSAQADRAARAAKRAQYPGEIVHQGSVKAALYEGLAPPERLARMAELCRSQWIASGGTIETLPRSEWPGEVFRILVADIELSQDYRDLLLALVEAGAEFLVIGGWALALHGHGRGTDDMDIFVRPEPANAERVYAALVAFGAPVAAHAVTADLFARPGYGYRIGIKPNLIELLTTIAGVTFDEACAGKRYFELEGQSIPYIGRAALLANKRAAARPKDLADVEWLESHDED